MATKKRSTSNVAVRTITTLIAGAVLVFVALFACSLAVVVVLQPGEGNTRPPERCTGGRDPLYVDAVR